MKGKVYADEAGRGTMIAAIGTIIAAYDNNDSGIRRGTTESLRKRGQRDPRKDEEGQINGGEKRVPAAAAS